MWLREKELRFGKPTGRVVHFVARSITKDVVQRQDGRTRYIVDMLGGKAVEVWWSEEEAGAVLRHVVDI